MALMRKLIFFFCSQVNDVNFENMTNDDAVRVLRDVVQKPGPIKVDIYHFCCSNLIPTF